MAGITQGQATGQPEHGLLKTLNLFMLNVPTFRNRTRRILQRSIAATLLASAAIAGGSHVQAQENNALIDALVRKGVLTTGEADDIRADLSKEQAQSSADKINISKSLTELRLYGDLRLRYDYNNRDYQADPFPVGANNPLNERSPSGTQRSRWRFRLRLNADFKLTDNFFGGVELQTSIVSDGSNQTFENGFSDYPIFISKAYLGWSPTEWLTVTAGKVPNPFYTTDLVWDADINPTGITEQIAFHKLFAHEEADAGYSKDGKSVKSVKASESPWELTLIAGQFIFDDNLEGGGRDPGVTDNDATTDAYLFQTQLVGSYRFSKDVKLTVAPGWQIYNGATAVGIENENPFQDTGLVSGATRNLNILLLPGDLAFKVAGIKTKFLWDFAYNIEARKRVEDIYRLTFPAGVGDDGVADPDDRIKGHSPQDDFAFLVGFQFGENKKKGDWSLLANYRQTGIGAVDPNLNDSDFANAELNTRGVKVGLAYNFTDFAVGAITYQYAWNLRDNLVGGEATEGNAIADSNNVQILQVDFNLKF